MPSVTVTHAKEGPKDTKTLQLICMDLIAYHFNK